jgi:hypothetical protein
MIQASRNFYNQMKMQGIFEACGLASLIPAFQLGEAARAFVTYIII